MREMRDYGCDHVHIPLRERRRRGAEQREPSPAHAAYREDGTELVVHTERSKHGSIAWAAIRLAAGGQAQRADGGLAPRQVGDLDHVCYEQFVVPRAQRNGRHG
jgi:hypothetical protein